MRSTRSIGPLALGPRIFPQARASEAGAVSGAAEGKVGGTSRHVRHTLTNMHLDHLREWEVFAASQ